MKNRYEEYFDQVKKELDKRKKKIEEYQAMKEKKEAEEKAKFFRPAIKERSRDLLKKINKKTKGKPIYKRVNQVLDEQSKYHEKLKKKYEEEDDREYKENCYFHPNLELTDPALAKEKEIQKQSEMKKEAYNILREAAKKKNIPLGFEGLDFEVESDINSKSDRSRSDVSKNSNAPRSKSPAFNKSINLKSFIEKQDNYIIQRRVNKELLKEHETQKLASNLRARPEISKNSKILAERSRSYLNINERLYEDAISKQKKLEMLKKDYNKEHCPFQPSIKKTIPKGIKRTSSKDDLAKSRELTSGLANSHFGGGDSRSQTPARDTSQSTAPRGILRTPNRESTPGTTPGRRTRKKVYIQDSVVNPPTRSYVGKEGIVNIVFDKRVVQELLDKLIHS